MIKLKNLLEDLNIDKKLRKYAGRYGGEPEKIIPTPGNEIADNPVIQSSPKGGSNKSKKRGNFPGTYKEAVTKPIKMTGTKFLGSYMTHNKKYSVKLSRTPTKGNAMGGKFYMDVTDNKTGKTITLDYSSQSEMKSAWKKLHKDNLR